MKFCPDCGVKLKNSNSGLQCPKCGHIDESEPKPTKQIVEDQEPAKDFTVFEADEGDEMLPTIEIECEKCGHNLAVWWMFQTRSADEPTTQFYRCQKCEYTWRNYA